MKVYVDELPKNCKDCPLRNYMCDSYWCSAYKGGLVLFADEVKEANLCPLQSLAEHDKQVRKEVREELKNKILYCSEIILKDGHYYNGKELDEILDQIKGEL